MANEPKPWTPGDPLDDKEDEEEVQRQAKAKARMNHLVEEYSKPKTPAGKKRRGLFTND